jgi:uncharacterized membrane protein YkvA (DUF1232 family)
MRFTFTLDEEDLTYFRRLLRDARSYAKDRDQSEIIAAVRELIGDVRKARRIPAFMEEALITLRALTDMVDDKDFNLPRAPAGRIVAALAYFAHPEDLIPDDIPGVGFLDDAIMVRLVEQEFEPELWGYKKFSKFRDTSEQRSWTKVARDRTAPKLPLKRKEILQEIERRRKRGGRFHLW